MTFGGGLGAVAHTQYLIVRILADTKSFQSDLARLNGQLTALSKTRIGLEGLGHGMTFLTRTTAAAVVAGGLLESQFIKVQNAQAGLARTLTDESAPAVAKLNDQIIEISKTVPVAVTELFRIAEVIGTTRIAADSIDELTKIVAKLSVTTDLSADEAAISMARLLDIFGKVGPTGKIAEGAAEGLGAALVRASQIFNATDQEVLRATLRFAALARMMKLTKGETLALAGAATGLGQLPEAVGGSMQRLLTIFSKYVGQYDQFVKRARKAGKDVKPSEGFTDEYERLAKITGLLPAQFAKLLKTDPFGVLVQFLEGFRKLSPTVQATLFGKGGIFPSFVRGQQTLQNLALTVDSAVKASKELDAEFEHAQSLEAAYAARTDTLAAKWHLLVNAFTRAGVAFGDAFNEELGDLILRITRYIDQSLPTVEEWGRKVAQFIKGVNWNEVKNLVGALFEVFKFGLETTVGLLKEIASFKIGDFPLGKLALQAAVLAKALDFLSGGGVVFASKLAGLAAGGVLRLVFDRFIERGSGPHNPVWVASITGGLGGADISSGSWRRLLLLLGVPIAFASGAITTGDTPRALQGPRDAGQVARLNQQQAEYLRLIEKHLAESVPGSPEWQRWEKNRLALLGGPFGIGPTGNLPPFGSDLAAAADITRQWRAALTDEQQQAKELAFAAGLLGDAGILIQAMAQKFIDALKPRHREGELGKSLQSAEFRALQRLDISDPNFTAKLTAYVDALVEHYTKQPVGTRGHPRGFIAPAVRGTLGSLAADMRQALREGNLPLAERIADKIKDLEKGTGIHLRSVDRSVERVRDAIARKRLSVRVNREPIHVRVGRPSVRTNVSVTIGKRSVIRSVYSGGGYGPAYVWGGNTGVLYEGPT